MINEENIEKLCSATTDDIELTTKLLNSYGFNNKDLNQLIEKQVLERIKKGHYKLISLDELFHYGQKLVELKEHQKAYQCFLKCYDLDSKNKYVSFKLFFGAIKNGNYNEAFNYFEQFYNNDAKTYTKASNFYLFLLSMITEVPEKYRDYTRNLKLKNIKIINKKSDEIIYLQNTVKILAFNQKFTQAYQQLNKLIQKQNKLTADDVIIKMLLKEATNVQIKEKKDMLILSEQKEYEKIITYLLEIEKKHALSPSNKCILHLARQISKYKKTGRFSNPTNIETNNFFDNILTNNFKAASFKSEQYLKNNNLEQTENIIFMLLQDINTLLNQQNPNTKETNQENTKKPNTTNPTPNIKTMNLYTTFAKLISYLTSQDYENTELTIKQYLQEIGKTKYEEIVLDLLKISIAEKDPTFNKLLNLLNDLQDENFTPSTILSEKYLFKPKKTSNNFTPNITSDDIQEIKASESMEFAQEEINNPKPNKTTSNTKLKIEEVPYQNDINNYYGIDNIFEIGKLLDEGKNIEEITELLELDERQKLLVYLILAREYFIKELYDVGDIYLKKVEQTKNKPKIVTELLNDIRKKKKFYKNRKEEYKMIVKILKK